MTFNARFSTDRSSFCAEFGPVQSASDGGFERGYAEGYADGVESVPDYLEMRIEGTLTEYSNPSITAVAPQAFRQLQQLTRLDLPNATSIGSESIRQCTSLTRLVFPKATSITTAAMSGCTSLRYVEFGATVTLGQQSLNNCSILEALVLRSDKLCTLSHASNVFTGTPIANGTGFIYVPDNLVEEYKTASNWSNYASQIKPISELPEQ